jgi:hypothetical protein
MSRLKGLHADLRYLFYFIYPVTARCLTATEVDFITLHLESQGVPNVTKSASATFKTECVAFL